MRTKTTLGQPKLAVTSAPHIHSGLRTSRIMLDVVIALLPALAAGVWVLGPRALAVTLASVLAAVASEWIFCLASGRRGTLSDGSAVVTGVLLGMTLPVSMPLCQTAVGSAFAIVVMKGFCGGLGQNLFNPALAGRAFLMLVWPASVVSYSGLDGVSAPTPLHHMVMPAMPEESLWDLFLGRCPGSIGEISTLALLLGGGYLAWRKVLSLRIPAAYLGTVAVLTLAFPRAGGRLAWMAGSLFSGGVMLGAIFMATDYATSPVTPKGRILFGMGCGGLTVALRYFGLFPEGVTYAILLMNACVPWIERHTVPRRFGGEKGGKTKCARQFS